MKVAKVLSVRVKELREAAGISQQELAIKADLSLSQVSQLEQGKKADPRASTILRLAAALDVTPGRILDDLPALMAAQEKKAKPKKAARKKKKKSVAPS